MSDGLLCLPIDTKLRFQDGRDAVGIQIAERRQMCVITIRAWVFINPCGFHELISVKLRDHWRPVGSNYGVAHLWLCEHTCLSLP